MTETIEYFFNSLSNKVKLALVAVCGYLICFIFSFLMIEPIQNHIADTFYRASSPDKIVIKYFQELENKNTDKAFECWSEKAHDLTHIKNHIKNSIANGNLYQTTVGNITTSKDLAIVDIDVKIITAKKVEENYKGSIILLRDILSWKIYRLPLTKV